MRIHAHTCLWSSSIGVHAGAQQALQAHKRAAAKRLHRRVAAHSHFDSNKKSKDAMFEQVKDFTLETLWPTRCAICDKPSAFAKL